MVEGSLSVQVEFLCSHRALMAPHIVSVICRKSAVEQDDEATTGNVVDLVALPVTR
jgi:hypothetical protein